MAQPYVGEIRMFAGNFAPNGWAFCDGSLVLISDNQTLFQLIGTTYGGDGQTTYGLPDLRGRMPIHMGTGPSGTTYQLGEMGGVETITLTSQQIPAHNHAFIASKNQAGNTTPPSNVLGQIPGGNAYIAETADTALNAGSIGLTGGSQPHDNMQPFLCVSFIISLLGIFPSQS
jgi:microcystin-dependent protein